MIKLEQEITFKCKGDSLEEIPESIIKKTGISFPQAHQSSETMASLAEEMQKHKSDPICRVPFCATVEAEAFGARINLGNNKTGPLVAAYAANTIEELSSLTAIDFNKGRIKAVLDSVEMLCEKKKIVALNVEGPFTIISSLVDMTVLFKGIRKNKKAVQRLFQVIEDSIVAYILRGLEKGARIISYGDPVGSMDIVGPKIFQEYSGKSALNILKRVEPHLDGAFIHLCGKTSTSLAKLENIESVPIELEENSSYGQVICRLLDGSESVNFIGHNCIKRTPLKMKKSVVWELKIKEDHFPAI